MFYDEISISLPFRIRLAMRFPPFISFSAPDRSGPALGMAPETIIEKRTPRIQDGTAQPLSYSERVDNHAGSALFVFAFRAVRIRVPRSSYSYSYSYSIFVFYIGFYIVFIAEICRRLPQPARIPYCIHSKNPPQPAADRAPRREEAAQQKRTVQAADSMLPSMYAINPRKW